MSDPTTFVRYASDGPVARITLTRPQLHILNLEMLGALDQALATAEADDDIAIVVIESRGGRAFCAGVDVADHVLEKVDKMLTRFHGCLRRLLSWDRISVAVVHGPALGGGCELVGACDLVLAGEEASFGQPEIALGTFPPAAAALFPLTLPRAMAADLCLTGRRWHVETARIAGLVSRVLPQKTLRADADAIVAELAEKSPAVLRVMKRAFGAGGREEALAALARAEQVYRDELTKLEDMQEGIAAFLEKRDPVWKNR